ncbi:MAG: ferredoxin--NADP reductase [Saprospiraceae bacterium]
MDFFPLKISNIIIETPDTKTFVLDVPSDLKQNFSFFSGQYLTLSFNIFNEEYRRSYSICTPPHSGQLAVTVKSVVGGTVSNHMNKMLKIGDTISAMVPAGGFRLIPESDQKRQHYFFAAGSGITPVISMIETVLEDEPKSTCHLFYGSRNEHQIIFKTRLEQLISRYSGQFFVHYILSRPIKYKAKGLLGLFGKKDVKWDGLTGRIDVTTLSNFFKDQPIKSERAIFYLCGPGDFISHIEVYLKSRNIEKNQIKKEYFLANTNSPKSTIMGLDSMAKITLRGETFSLQIPAGTTILEALKDDDKDPPYSCSSGACATCMAKVTKGSVTMDACYALEDEEIAKGFVLTCQSKPQSPEIELTFEI